VIEEERLVHKGNAKDDLVLSSFMSFLAADMLRSPEHVTPLDGATMKRICGLVSNVESDPKENLGDVALI
jgi:hypothetical protein